MWLYFGSLCFVLLIYLSTLPYANFYLRDSDRVIIWFPEMDGLGLGKLSQRVVCSEPGSLQLFSPPFSASGFCFPESKMAASSLTSHSSFWVEEEDKQVNSPAESDPFYQKKKINPQIQKARPSYKAS